MVKYRVCILRAEVSGRAAGGLAFVFFFFNLCRIPAEASVRSWGRPEVSQLPHITASFLQFTSSNLTQSFTGACLSALAFGFQLPWCPFASEKKSEECSPLTLSNYLDLLITTKSTLVSWWKKQELVVTFPQRYFILSSVSLSSE